MVRGFVFVLRPLHNDQCDNTKFTYYISNGKDLKAAVTCLMGKYKYFGGETNNNQVIGK